MQKIRILLIISTLTSLIAISNGADFLPAKPSVSSNCADKSALVNDYLVNIKYLEVLNQFIKELQTVIRDYQQELQMFISKSQAAIDFHRGEIFATKTRINVLRVQSQQKKDAINTLRVEIQALLSNERLTFQALNNAMCLYQGARTIAIAAGLERLVNPNPEQMVDNNYFKKTIALTNQIFTLVQACNKLPTKTNIAQAQQLNTTLGNITPIKEQDFSKRAAQIFASLQRRLLNAYILINQGKIPTDDPFTGIPPTAGIPARTTYNNLLKRVIKTIDPEIIKKTVEGYKSRIDVFNSTTKQEWQRAIKLYKFGYQSCDCQGQCAQALDKATCFKDCELRGKQQFSYMQRDCNAECKLLANSCNKLCTGDIAESCKIDCANAKTNCVTTCNVDNEQKNKNWQHCVNISKTCNGAIDKENPEICSQFQSLGIADIQNEIDVLQKQITKPAKGEQPSATNIPAKIDRIMNEINRVKTIIENKINGTKSVIDKTVTTINAIQATIKSTKIETLLPADNNAKMACAKSIQSLLPAAVDLTPARVVARQLVAYLNKTYGNG